MRYVLGIWNKVVTQLETPREERPLGSGWLSGSLALLASLAGLLIVMLRWFPETFSYPEIAFIQDSGVVTVFLRFVLLSGYALSLLSLILSTRKSLGWTALALSVVASLMATTQPQIASEAPQSLYFGLDYFIINVSSLLVQVLGFITLAPSNYVNAQIPLDDVRIYIVTLPFFVQVIIIMMATDFVQYWVHRAFHTYPVLWRFHSIHHSTKKMDWLAGARMHFVEIAVLRSLTAVPMFTLGFKPEAIQAYLLVVYFYSSFIHANIGWKLGFLERFFVTPRFHHWHHGSDRAAIDINYSSHFPIYDWLFGTHRLPKEEWPEAYGVIGDTVPKGYWRQFVYPFLKPAKKEPAE